MSSDHQEIMELLEGIDAHNPATYSQYAKVEWRWIDDANNNNYNTSNILPTANTATSFPQINQIIKMDTKALIDKWIGYRQAFWYVPLTYTLGGTVNATVFSAPTIGAFASTPTAVVAIKNGLYQLVHALIISINGQQLNKLQSNYINMANHLHALIETSVDYAMSVGTFSGFKKDTLETLLNAGAPVGAAAITGALSYGSGIFGAIAGQVFNTSYNQAGGNDATQFYNIQITNGNGQNLVAANGATTAPALAANGATGVNTVLTTKKNNNFNKGFFDRINFTNSTYVVANGVGTGQFNACIALRVIHDYFRQLSIPLLGTQFYLQLTMASPNLSATQPLMIDTSVSTVTAGNTIANTLSLTIGNSNLANTRLYFPEITFNVETQAKVNAMLASGFQKEITWMDNYVVQGNQNTSTVAGTAGITGWPNATNTNTNFLITPGLSRPQRVFLITPRAGGISSAYYADPCFSYAQYTNMQLLVDTKPLFPQLLQYDFEAYNLLKEEFISHGRDPQDGSLIGWDEWIANNRVYVFNCSRMVNSLPDPSKEVSLSFIGQRIAGDTLPVDQYFIVEVECSTLMSFSSGKVKIL